MKTLLLFLALFAAPLFAEPLKLTNKQADELAGALEKIGPGLSAANTTKAARNILALRPVVEAYAKGIEAAKTNHRITASTRADAPEAGGFVAEITKLQTEVITVDLARFTLSDEEIERSRPSPVAIATLLLYLEPKK